MSVPLPSYPFLLMLCVAILRCRLVGIVPLSTLMYRMSEQCSGFVCRRANMHRYCQDVVVIVDNIPVIGDAFIDVQYPFLDFQISYVANQICAVAVRMRSFLLNPYSRRCCHKCSVSFPVCSNFVHSKLNMRHCCSDAVIIVDCMHMVSDVLVHL